MAMSERLRDSNQLAQATYRSERRKQLGSDALTASTDISDYRSPGLVDPETVQDNTIVLLVEAGTCVNLDIEHPDQPPSTHYTTDASDKIGIRYLEVADDSIEVCRVEANNGILNAYERDSELGSGPKTARQIFACPSLGGTWNPIKKVWEIENVEIRLFGRIPPATIRRMLSYYTIRPAHSYGFFTRLNMNDWDDYSDLEDNQINSPSFPTTRYAPVREIVVHGSKMTHINLNTMQYLYYAYIGGYTKARMIKIAYCPVLKAIGSVGIWGKRDNRTSTAFGIGSYKKCKSLKAVPGVGYNVPIENGYEMYRDCNALMSASWMDTNKCTNFSYMYAYTSISSLPPYNLQNAKNLNSFLMGCTELSSVELVAYNVTDASNLCSGCTKLTEFALITSTPSHLTHIYGMLSRCPNLITTQLFDTSLVTNAQGFLDGSTKFNRLPAFDFHSVTNAEAMFARTGLTNRLPSINLSSAITASNLFSDSKLTELPNVITSDVLVNATAMYANCTGMVGIFDNVPGDNGAPTAAFVSTSIIDAPNMFSGTKLTMIEIDLTAAKNVENLCHSCTSLVSVNIRLTNGTVTRVGSLFYNCSALSLIQIDTSTYGSAVVNADYTYANINWTIADNTGFVILNFPNATSISGCISGCNGRQFIKMHNISKLPDNSGNPFYTGLIGGYKFPEFPAHKLWILNATCQRVFSSWRDFVNLPNLAAATFEITLESVTEFNPAWLNNMVRLTKVTFINEPLDFQATAGLWIAANNFQTNPLLTEISLQGQVTPEFVKAVQVVAPTTVNYTGSITILHHNDLAWT